MAIEAQSEWVVTPGAPHSASLENNGDYIDLKNKFENISLKKKFVDQIKK